MIIHLVRHAEAIDRSPDIAEEHRFLTPKGRNRCRKICVAARKDGIDPDVIITSPLIRAVQTAEILAQALKFKGALTVATPLAHGFKLDDLEKLLQRFPQAQEIALVGHEPELGTIAGALMQAQTTCNLEKGAIVSFKKSNGSFIFKRLVDGGAKVFTSLDKALKVLTQA